MQFINLHTHHHSNQLNTFELVNQYPLEYHSSIPYYSMGIHPWFIKEATLDQEFEILTQKIQDNNCLAIGECGLDKRIDVPLDLQKAVFERQLLLAQHVQKPVIIHCVAAFDELIECTKRLQIKVPIIVHGFSKNSQVANQLIQQGFYISFGKYLFQMPNLASVLNQIPEERFFLETDTALQSIEDVYQLVAKSKGISVPALQEKVKQNFESIFNTKIEA
ncbi:MAG: TatD family hydrolase [Flavobacterium sp.]|nr:TatD family hydrolase [Flavobacterium sp.]